MRLEMHQGQRLEQQMKLAPRMIQAMQILQLPMMALQERIQHELEENPVLELKENHGEDPASVSLDFAGSDSLPPDKPSDPDRDPLVVDEKSSELDFDQLDALTKDWGDVFNEDHRPLRSGLEEEGDKKHDAMQNMASRPQSLQEYLSEQLPYLELDEDETRLVKHVISYIDRTGYLGLRMTRQKAERKHDGRKKKETEEDAAKPDLDNDEEIYVPVTLEEIVQTYDRPVTVEQVEEALHEVQKLDPPGVGARDLRECLLLQLNEETPHYDVVRALVLNHLEDIQHNRLPVIQKRTGFDLNAIKEGIEALKHLNPRPGAAFAEDSNRYVTPDVAIEQAEDGSYTIRLLDDWMPKIYVSRKYIEMYRNRGGEKKTREYLKDKIQKAQWLQEAIEQRRNTLEKVTRAIIDHQKAFLDKGPEFIEPLKMQQIADQVGVHVTTVSRAVDDKYVQTPRGTFPLKRFFGGGKETASGEMVAWEIIKRKLLEMIEGEDKSNPLSDEELVDHLEKAGYPIKRRTVTKYRKMLDIPSSRQRKDWTLVSESNGHSPQPAAVALDSEDDDEDE